mmetsp:Transcript_12690/g.18661  ORF Transcript_12690/g.18661 Transcript_12690/m.18661 type:complete len:392 (-) Transcript_12690:192-1367(-)
MASGIATARWDILRAALRGKKQGFHSEASIHRFEGWKLLSKARITFDASKDVRGQLVPSDCKNEDYLCWVLAEQCIRDDQGNLYFTISPEGIAYVQNTSFREDLARQGILTKVDPKQNRLYVRWSYCSYTGIEYNFENGISLRIRERKSQKRVTLQELASHNLNDGVDNTGQTCVWDSECTLAHCLLNKDSGLRKSLKALSQLSSCHRVLEIGSGMAGLAAMALAKIYPVGAIISDGHPSSVLNNKVNIQMNRFEGVVHCKRLLWSTDIQEHVEEFDLVLCSDCTHFQEHHADLSVTLGSVLKIGGRAILCQPPRTNSLSRFLQLCDALEGVWNWEEVIDEDLNKKHMESSADPHYSPNLHRAKLILLTKLRSLTPHDRRLAVEVHKNMHC